MPGFFDSLGQGLQAAGGILSPEVFDAQQKQRQQSIEQLQRLQMALMGAVQNGSASPEALTKVDLPSNMIRMSPEARAAQANLQSDQALREALKNRSEPIKTADDLYSLLGSVGPENLTGPMGERLYQVAATMKAKEDARKPQVHFNPVDGSVVLVSPDGTVKKVDTGSSGTISAYGKELLDAGYEKGGPEYIRMMEEKVRKEILPPQYVFNMNQGAALSGLSDSQIKDMSWPDYVKAHKLGMTPQAYQIGSEQYALTGVPPRSAMGNQMVRNAWEDGRAKVALQFGKTPEEMAAMPAEWKANAGALLALQKQTDGMEAVLSSFHSNLESFDRVAKGLDPKFKSDFSRRFSAMDFTGVQTLDQYKQRLLREFNDPTSVALGIAAMESAMDYGRIAAGGSLSVAVTPVSAMENANKLIQSSMNDKSRAAAISALDQGALGQVSGRKERLEAVKKRMRLSSGEPTPETPAGLPAGAQMIGHTKDGKPVYQTPDGKKWVQ